MRTIAIANQKGGVGKTTTAVNLSACLARAGYRTLLVDLDHQTNASDHLGIDSPEDEALSSWALLAESRPNVQAIIQPVSPNLMIAPGHIALAEIDLELQSVIAREVRLRKALTLVADQFDYTIIDCAPSVGVATVNALCAAYRVIIAIQTNRFAFGAVKRLMKIISDVRESINPELGFYALATLHRSNVNIHRDVLAKLQEFFGDLTLNAVIRHTATLAEASANRQSIVDYAGGSKGHLDHQTLMEELISRVERTTTKQKTQAI